MTDDRPATIPTHLERGAALGRYVVLDPLGAGGMGVVYAAYDAQLDRRVAIKLLHEDRDGPRSDSRARILREAKALGQLSHPNVVTIHEVGMVRERVYLVMEYVEGRTLREWLDAGPKTKAEVLEVFLAAGAGLAAAHAAGLVHRDFKPDNVMIDTTGRVRVMDFGLARAPAITDEMARRDPAADSASGPGDASRDADGTLPTHASSELSAQLTRQSTIVGTPAYMAPEQWAGANVDARTDQYALCVTLYEALYGRRPYSGKTQAELAVAAMEGTVEAAPAGARVPAWLRRVVVRGLSPDPADRHPDVPALLAALRADPTASRRRWLLGASVLVVAAGAITADRVAALRRDASCEARGREITEVWDDDARDRVRAALVDEAGGRGEATWARLAPRIDGYVAQWSDVRVATCRQPPAGSVDGEPLATRADACLHERRIALGGLVDAITSGRDGTVERVIRAATELPPSSPCAEEAWLRRRVAAPRDAAMRAKVDELDAELVRARAGSILTPGDAPIATVRDVLARASALEWEPLRARAYFELGTALSADARVAQAEPAFRDAYLHAAALDDLPLALRAANALTTLVSGSLHRPDEAELWSSLADVAAKRLAIADDGLEMAERLEARADATFSRGDADAALALYERGLEIRQTMFGPDHPSLTRTLAAISACHSARGDGPAARAVLERVLALQERVLGPDHPDVAYTLADLSIALGVEERYDESYDLAARALAIRERIYGPAHLMVASSLATMCAADADRGRVDRAEPECARALSIYERERGSDDPEVGWIRVSLAIVARARGDLARAQSQARRAFDALAGSLGAEHPRAELARELLAELDEEAAR